MHKIGLDSSLKPRVQSTELDMALWRKVNKDQVWSRACTHDVCLILCRTLHGLATIEEGLVFGYSTGGILRRYRDTCVTVVYASGSGGWIMTCHNEDLPGATDLQAV